MKKILTAVAMALLLVGCAKQVDDNSELLERIAGLETRVTALESSIMSIQSAIGDGVFVQKVEQYADPATGKIVGVTVTYTSGKVVYFEITPKADYAGPVLGVISNGAGQLVWAVDGVAIKVNGKEVPVYQTPVFTIDDDGNLLVSIDGSDPVIVGKVQNSGATLVDGIFTNLAVTDDAVVLTLSDGTTVSIPFAEAFKLIIEKSEYAYNSLGAFEIPYTVSAKTENTEVGVIGYSPVDFNVVVEADKIIVKPLRYNVAAVMMAYADSKIGLTSVVKLTVEPEGVIKVDTPWSEEEDIDYVIDGEGGIIESRVVSNVDFDVKSANEWIHAVSVKGDLHVITLSVDKNTIEEERIGTVLIYAKNSGELVQLITILQGPAVPDEGDITDLSQFESANSYLITEAGSYKFKAVKGNSAISVGAAAKAEILWETENTDTAPEANAIIAKVSYSDGYVSFSTPATLKPGNALIAVKDASDVVLWSWHIWIPADNVTVWNSEAFAGAKMLDRNLGALKATAKSGDVDPLSIGLYYQWGRKDPFPGAVTFEKNPAGAKVAGEGMTYHQELITIDYSIQHPTEYASVPEVDDGVWNVEDPKDLWNADGDLKTIYDPCPPGYRVPLYDKSLPMWAGSDEGFTYEDGVPRFSYGDFTFTVAGYLDCWGGSYAYSNLRSHIWASKWYDEKRGTCLYYRGDKDPKYYSQKYHKAKAGSVRCVVDGNAPVPDLTEDLSANATANSYIVEKAGDFKFKAVKGNSDESVGAVESAEILWETWCNDAEVTANSVIADVSVDNGYIYFSTPAELKPGNALIAAKDANGVILWSWHIWIPATKVVSTTHNFWSTPMMDRNLGALVAAKVGEPTPAESFGMSYQWGRKDPFVGPKSPSSGSNATVAGAEVTQIDATMTVEESIQNPTVIGHTNDADWLPAPDNTLWQNDVKTIYDPCPAGYKIPARDKTQPLMDDLSLIAGWAEDAANGYVTFGDPLAVFPVCGYRDDYSPGSFSKVYQRVAYWTSYASADAKGYLLNIRLADYGNAHKASEGPKARGGFVRCVAE